ncbi:PAS domain-containing protein [Sphingomonas sp. PAMC 26617]|uniref:PAS domain-containing protein n=1 Tax=Sphingomonas sp. PAMC 26617 TaxID=1112216 RepID=UPI0018DED297|nr:PAS domain-containing protein [Sphingomonas sp. PAMC 26617]
MNKSQGSNADFGSSYWRAPAALPYIVSPSTGASIDDTAFRLLADNIPTLCWIADGDGFIFWYNRRWHEYCGSTPEQMEGWGWQSVHDPAKLDAVMAEWTHSIATGEPFEMTFPLRGADGMLRPFLTRIQPVRDATGDVVRWFGVNTDVSAQYIVEDRLNVVQGRGRSVLASMNEGFALLDHEFRVLDINAEGLRFDQRGRDDIVGRSHWEVWPGSEDSSYGELYKRVARTGVPETAEFKYEWHHGGSAWMEVRAFPHPEGVAVFYRDIGDRKRAEAEMRAGEARMRAVLEASPVGLVFAEAPVGKIIGGNARAEEILGHAIYHSTDVAHYGEWVSFHGDGRQVEGYEYPLARVITGAETRAELDVLYQRGDRGLAYVRFVATPIVDDAGNITGGVVASLDVDRERRAELRQALFLELADRTRLLDEPREIVRTAVELLGKHLGVSRVGFGELTPDERHVVYEVDYTDGVENLIGTYPVEAFGVGNVADLRAGRTTAYADVTLDPRTRDADFTTIETRAAMAVPLVRGGRLLAGIYVNHKDPRAWSADEVSLVEQVAERTWDALQRATAERKLHELNATLEQRVEERSAELLRTEEALRQSQKMEAVGQLTGGIAHDFNNMLAVVMGSLDLLTRRMATDDARAKRYIDAATEGAKRAANLTQRLLAFSHQQPLKPEPIDVNRLVTGMSDLLMHSLGGTVQLETVLAGGLWPVHADPNQLENVVLNLAINGRDAMPSGGKMTVETQNAHLDSRYAADEIGIVPGQYVLIAVTDSGTGMPQEVIDKAFDPFFTTKEVGKGTGLGLSQVYGFIKQSGGHVRIYSELGQGSTVKLYLPRLIGHKSSSDKAETEADLPLGERHELILVVEDEPSVRQLSCDALTELGYRVVEADSAKAALQLLDANPEIALIFTDIMMPEMNGAQLAKLAREKRPDVPILFTTGYTRNAVVHNGVVDAGVELIGKPFTIEELAARVRTVLDR